jgi:hypothetical protein
VLRLRLPQEQPVLLMLLVEQASVQQPLVLVSELALAHSVEQLECNRLNQTRAEVFS